MVGAGRDTSRGTTTTTSNNNNDRGRRRSRERGDRDKKDSSSAGGGRRRSRTRSTSRDRRERRSTAMRRRRDSSPSGKRRNSTTSTTTTVRSPDRGRDRDRRPHQPHQHHHHHHRGRGGVRPLGRRSFDDERRAATTAGRRRGRSPTPPQSRRPSRSRSRRRGSFPSPQPPRKRARGEDDKDKDSTRTRRRSSPSQSSSSNKKKDEVTSATPTIPSGGGGGSDKDKDKNNDDEEGEVEDDDSTEVDRWVRSAPAEVYYQRTNEGYYIATKKTKNLCSKFERKLLLPASTARLESERKGVAKMEELTIKEQNEIKERKEKKNKKKKKGKENHEHHGGCNHHKDHDHDHDHHDPPPPPPPAPDQNGSGGTTEPKEPCNHEEGEICDCEEEQGKNDPPPNNQNDGCSSTAKTTSCCDHNNKEGADNPSPSEDPTKETKKKKKHSHKSSGSGSSSSSSSSDTSSSSDSSDDDDEEISSRSSAASRELEKRKQHPSRLHMELWHNDPGLMNDGPVCRCSAKARRFGIRHGYYPGEDKIPMCDPFSNNMGALTHYRITISPAKNFLVKTPTVIPHDGHEYIFEGFSLFSHYKVDLNLPPCRVIRFNIRYEVFITEEKFPESFCVKELQLFETYLFREVLELLDLKYDWAEQGGCAPFHLMPRFVRQLPDNGKEILSMNRVLIHMLDSDKEIFKKEELSKYFAMDQSEWQNFADLHKGMIVTKFGLKPCALRVDQIDRDTSEHEKEKDGTAYPAIVHFGIRPPQLSYAGNAEYQRAWRQYVKLRHLLSNMPKPKPEEKSMLAQKEMKLQEMRTTSTMKRDVTIAVSSKGFRSTGIFCDVVQHAMLVPVLASHLRFHKSLGTLEVTMNYQFTNRTLLQLAMTHPSYRENFGTNPDHARNALTNCGIRQPEYGDRRIHYASTRKRGITTLINIMAKFGFDHERESEITHNERLEFLGDAVVEFISSIHLFHLFPDLEEGGLATYRAAIVQNQHLAVLAKTLGLDEYMLYAHGSDLCHDSELRHAMANCFEALMGALYLDGGIEVADRVLAKTLFNVDDYLHNVWVHYPPHSLQQEEKGGDRHWISSHKVLQKLTEFEGNIGIQFTHIRLLARAFTDRSLGYNNLSRGSNQRLEFLGDTVLQLITSSYLYRHFPDHHEGHLSLLRSALVNNRTQAIVCDDLGLPTYAMRGDPKAELKMKDRADLLEAVLGALYVDKGLTFCTTFCSICFFPLLTNSITKQEWNDPKSKLQQCCLTLRTMNGREPDIPVYKVTESLGPTNTRIYTVAVYFRGERLATAKGHSIQEAEMNAAGKALEQSGHLFPQLHHQKSVVDKNTKKVIIKHHRRSRR